MNNIVGQIYVINMKKDTKRLTRFIGHIGNLFEYILIEGVDPINDEKYNIEFNEWINNKKIINYQYFNFNWKYYINKYDDLKKANINTKVKAWEHWIKFGEKELRSCNPNNNIVNKGQWGCLYSHIKILEDAIKQNYESILILEDDIILTRDIENKIDKLNEFININSNWNIIYLGASQHNWDNINLKGKDYYLANKSTGTFAYMVHNRFYKILLNEYYKMSKPVDNYLVDIQQKYYGSIYVLYPNIIVSNLEESNIGENRKNIEYFKKFRWVI